MGDTIPSVINNDSSVDLTNAQSLLVYPAHEQRDAWLQSWCAIGPHNNFEQSLEKMLNEFGSYFVVLQASNVDEYVKLVSKASGADVSYGLVQYSDNPLDRSLTVKDSKLCYQKEFRFYVGECSKDEVSDKKLQLNGLNNILSNAASLKLTSPSGEIRYCSLGSKKVVTTNE